MTNLSVWIIAITIFIVAFGAVLDSFAVSFIGAPVFFFVAVIVGHVYRSITYNFKKD
jgi:TRAP-type C4-dicarboxylate transport system permease large subunit